MLSSKASKLTLWSDSHKLVILLYKLRRVIYKLLGKKLIKFKVNIVPKDKPFMVNDDSVYIFMNQADCVNIHFKRYGVLTSSSLDTSKPSLAIIYGLFVYIDTSTYAIDAPYPISMEEDKLTIFKTISLKTDESIYICSYMGEHILLN